MPACDLNCLSREQASQNLPAGEFLLLGRIRSPISQQTLFASGRPLSVCLAP